MRAAGDQAAAGMLLDELGALRKPQEVVGIVDALDKADAAADAARVLAAAVRRPAPEVARIVGVLLKIERPDILDRLRAAAAGLDAPDVAALAELLSPDQRDALLDRAVDDRFGRPAAMIELVSTLSTAPALDGVLDSLLERTAARIPAFDAAVLGDVLREAGRGSAAFRVYHAAVEVLAGRPAADVTGIAAAMHTAGLADQARALIGRAIQRCGDVPAILAMLDAVEGSPLPNAVDDTIIRAATVLPAEELLRLARELWVAERDDAAGDLLAWAAVARPASETAVYLVNLHEAGRLLDARRVVEAVGERDESEIAGFMSFLVSADADALPVLIDVVLAGDAGKAGRVLVELDRSRRAVPIRHFVEHTTRVPAETVLAVMSELIRADLRSLSRRVAAACDAAFRVDFAWPYSLTGSASRTTVFTARAKLIIDLAVGSPTIAAAVPVLVGKHPWGSRDFAEYLTAEPPGIVIAVLTRMTVAGDGAYLDAILVEVARKDDVVRWLSRLWHVAPEPAGTGGRRPDLVDRYLDHVVRLRTPRQIVALLHELEAGHGPSMADRIVEMLLDDPGRRWARALIGVLLGESRWTESLTKGTSVDRELSSRMAAVEELVRQFDPARKPVAYTVPARVVIGNETNMIRYGPAPLISLDQWKWERPGEHDERALWLIRLGTPQSAAFVGFSNRGVYCRFPGRRANGSVRRADGRRARPNRAVVPAKDFYVAYLSFAGLRFEADGLDINIEKPWTRRRLQPDQFWAIPQADPNLINWLTGLLNALAMRVREVHAVDPDRPLGPSRRPAST
ncbi:hypothetical protein GCM10010436_54080 [Paractinoplanes durhamensis]